MVAVAKKAAFGAAFQIKIVETYTEVAQVHDIKGPSESVTTFDVTTHDQSTAQREYLVGLIDNGTVSLEMYWDPADTATHKAITDNLRARTLTLCKIICSDSTAITFSGYFVGKELSHPIDGPIGASIEFKLSGAIT